MLNITVTPHREHFNADSPGQMLYIALELKPGQQASNARPDLALAFVIDTSGSMREVVTTPTERTGETVFSDGKTYDVVRGGRTKLDLVISSLRGVLEEAACLSSDDRMAVIRFDDSASVVLPFTNISEKIAIADAAARLEQFSGGTMMGAGLREAVSQLAKESGSKRIILLSDGHTFDESLVKSISDELLQMHVPVTVVGVGSNLNLDLLTSIADKTQGRMMDVVPDVDNPQPPSIRVSDLPSRILDEICVSGTEVVTDIELTLNTIQDVQIHRISRVFPVQVEVDTRQAPYLLGNVSAGTETVYIIEATLPARPAARMRLAQLGLTYKVPGAHYRGEFPPSDVVVEYTRDGSLASVTNPMVMHYVQQRNIEHLIHQATLEAQSDPEAARAKMAQARALTVRLGNPMMTKALDRAMDELGSSKTISLGTAKTLRIGAKTQTVRLEDSDDELPPDEEIRRLTGL